MADLAPTSPAWPKLKGCTRGGEQERQTAAGKHSDQMVEGRLNKLLALAGFCQPDLVLRMASSDRHQLASMPRTAECKKTRQPTTLILLCQEERLENCSICRVPYIRKLDRKSTRLNSSH